MSTDQVNFDDPALARKRRMKQRAIQRAEERDDASSKHQRHDDCGDDETESYEDRTKPSIRGIKQQARYIPGVPMTKEELAAWRKEARRVRNRESAADSRKKTRDRIGELESEVERYQTKYAAAVKRIVELEAATAASSLHHHDSFTPDHMRQDLIEDSHDLSLISPSSSVVPSPELSPEAMPFSLCESFSLDGGESSHHEQVSQNRLCPDHLLIIDSLLCSRLPSNPLPAAKINIGADTNLENSCSWETTSSSPWITTSSSETDTTSSLSETASSRYDESSNSSDDPEDDAELGEFLWDAFGGFDPNLEDLSDLCL